MGDVQSQRLPPPSDDRTGHPTVGQVPVHPYGYEGRVDDGIHRLLGQIALNHTDSTEGVGTSHSGGGRRHHPYERGLIMGYPAGCGRPGRRD